MRAGCTDTKCFAIARMVEVLIRLTQSVYRELTCEYFGGRDSEIEAEAEDNQAMWNRRIIEFGQGIAFNSEMVWDIFSIL